MNKHEFDSLGQYSNKFLFWLDLVLVLSVLVLVVLVPSAINTAGGVLLVGTALFYLVGSLIVNMYKLYRN